MDWDRAIERNREALRRILAALVAMAGLAHGPAAAEEPGPSPAPTLPRRLHRAVLRLLRPAEAAARRLVVVAARGIAVELPKPRLRKAKPASAFLRGRVGTGILMPRNVLPDAARSRPARRGLSLPLLDPLPRHAKRPRSLGVPRISAPGVTAPFPVAPRRLPAPHDPIDATRLSLRLAALGRALDDLPGQARRLARWKARRDRLDPPLRSGGSEGRVRPVARPGKGPPKAVEGASNRAVRRLSPLRGGPPCGVRRPGSRRPVHEVDEVLADTHHFAFHALNPDTS